MLSSAYAPLLRLVSYCRALVRGHNHYSAASRLAAGMAAGGHRAVVPDSGIMDSPPGERQVASAPV